MMILRFGHAKYLKIIKKDDMTFPRNLEILISTRMQNKQSELRITSKLSGSSKF